MTNLSVFNTVKLWMLPLLVVITSGFWTSTGFIKHTGKYCKGDLNGGSGTILVGWVGSAEECKWKCLDLGDVCNGFQRVNDGSGSHGYDGKCYFRGGTLTIDSVQYDNDNRDCWQRSTSLAFIQHIGQICYGTGSDILGNFAGSMKQCQLKCDELGEDCVGFQRINDGRPEYNGQCFFRNGPLTQPEIYTRDIRDCFERVYPDNAVDGLPVVILNTGGYPQGYMQVGFGGEHVPRVLDYPSIVGRSPFPQDPTFFGREAWEIKHDLDLIYPIQYDILTAWDNMVLLWDHVIREELKVEPQNHCFLLSVDPMIGASEKELLAAKMFEEIGAQCLYFEVDAVLALYASQRTTGMVVYVHEDITHIVPIHNGKVIKAGYRWLQVAVKDLVVYLSEILLAEEQVARDILTKFGYVALDYGQEFDKPEEDVQIKYTLPDGNELTVKHERFQAVEALFAPSMIGQESQGIAHLIFESIYKCDADIRPDLYANVIIAGPGSIYPGFAERLLKELKVYSTFRRMKVIAPSEKKISAWIGGSIAAKLFQQDEGYWIMRDEYDDRGPSIVHCHPQCDNAAHQEELNSNLIDMDNNNDNEYYLRINIGKNKFILILIFGVIVAFIVMSACMVWSCCNMMNRKEIVGEYDEIRVISDTD